jgi:hypothetical protein
MDLDETITSLNDVSTRLRGATEKDADLTDLAKQLIKNGTEEIETILRRKIVTRGTITEYHTFRCGTARLWLAQWPVLTITSIHEDPDRDYGASTLLVSGTDYLVDNDSGLVTRIEDDATIAWETGLETVRVVYTAGYTQATVPGDLKQIALELFDMQWKEAIRGNVGRASATGDLGSATYFGPAELTSHMIRRLSRHEKPLREYDTLSRASVA